MIAIYPMVASSIEHDENNCTERLQLIVVLLVSIYIDGIIPNCLLLVDVLQDLKRSAAGRVEKGRPPPAHTATVMGSSRAEGKHEVSS